jgi:5-oxoprolinase (ATP-hydrolysing)
VSAWQFWVDRGGTFTDIVARAPDGRLTTLKLLSEDPGRYDDAAVEGVRRILGERQEPFALRIGTTLATNALLERKGAPVCLAITKGFADALVIGTQDRPDLFAREIKLPPPLFDRAMEIDERVRADGTIERPMDLDAARAALQAAYDDGLRALAIVLMHAYRYPAHEAALAALARGIGLTQISVSHEVAPVIKLIGRGDSAVVDAYLSPLLSTYVDGLECALGEAGMLFMQSNGALASGAAFRGLNAVLSGPAGGVVGMARTAEAAGCRKVIGFDMGGTSTDVTHYAGAYERDAETRIGGARLRTPMMRIHTVAAGGGSICRFKDGRFQVGPESAGATPGPACYRRGGPLTVTDCNLVLGKIQAGHFPAVFGPNGDEPLDAAASAARIDTIRAEMGAAMSPAEIAEGFVAVAVANMANAIHKISVQRGHDVGGYTLACFGGAGGQHACLVADALGMERVMIHPLAGVLSAYGMGLARRGALRERTIDAPLEDDGAITEAVRAVEAAALADLRGQGVAGDVSVSSEIHIKIAGGESPIAVPFGPTDEMRSAFTAAYREQFGFEASGALIADMVRSEASEGGDDAAVVWPLPDASAAPIGNVACHMAGKAHETPLFDRGRLAAGWSHPGPAIVIDPISTTVVEPGWRAEVDAQGNLTLTRAAPRAATAQADPVRLEIFNGLFMGIAEEMGAALQRTAASVNIRERLDFSCAIFDGEGSLVANAPHMPVHLGSMGESVRAVMRKVAKFAPGDAYALNAPYEGGTHLPDITVIMPVFAGGKAPDFWVAARGHHADIGGIAPGSMPPDSISVEEEGVLLDCVPIVRAGQFLEDDLRTKLSGGHWPSRGVEQNIADLRAQVAACAKGASGLQSLATEQGVETVCAFMARVQDTSEAAVRRLVRGLSDGNFRLKMDNGAEIAVAVTVDRDAGEATIDFTGTSPQQPSNFNAPLPVVRAAVLYVVRTLIDDPVPMNEGCLRPIRIVVPEGSFISPAYPAAVVAGNVETSQALCDALFGALGAMAAAQGTMNNFTFGNARHQYYETIAGGAHCQR